MSRLARGIDCLMARLTFPMAILSALLMFYDALHANYPGVAWNYFWTMVLFGSHIRQLGLDHPTIWHLAPEVQVWHLARENAAIRITVITQPRNTTMEQ